MARNRVALAVKTSISEAGFEKSRTKVGEMDFEVVERGNNRQCCNVEVRAGVTVVVQSNLCIPFLGDCVLRHTVSKQASTYAHIHSRSEFPHE